MQAELFPREVVTHVPRITLSGREKLHIEQHQGLMDYEPEHILLRTSCGPMRIAGAGMTFQLYSAAEAVITGRIDSVIFSRQEDRS